MKQWLCNITVGFVITDVSQTKSAMAALRHVWGQDKEIGWDAVVIDATDEQGLVAEINARFKKCLSKGCTDPALIGASILDPLKWPVVWRVGTQFHGVHEPVRYIPKGDTKDQPWRLSYNSGMQSVDVMLQVTFRELASAF